MKKSIAITGGIGSGKSTVAEILKKMQFPVFSCDEINRELLCDENYLMRLREIFPECFSREKLDKARLSEQVFSDKEKRKRLDALAHPWIMRRLSEEMKNETKPIVFAEVPLLFECGFEKNFDGAIVVLRERNIRLQAVMARDAASKEEAENRIAAQYDYAEEDLSEKARQIKIYRLHNDGDFNRLEESLVSIVKLIRSEI